MPEHVVFASASVGALRLRQAKLKSKFVINSLGVTSRAVELDVVFEDFGAHFVGIQESRIQKTGVAMAAHYAMV